jgi:phage terminase Nu1 subunit (DNA packaging protein)
MAKKTKSKRTRFGSSTDGSPNFDLESHWSQKKFAELLRINQSQVSRAISRGTLKRNDTCMGWLRDYIHHLSEEAAGRRGKGGLDLVQERARLSKLQADRILLEFKQKRRELLHIDSVVLAVSEMLSITRTRFLALPHKLKSILPYILPADVLKIRDEVYECLTALSRMKLRDDVVAKINETDIRLWGDIGVDPNEDGANHGERNDHSSGGGTLPEDPRGRHEEDERKTDAIGVFSSGSNRGTKKHIKHRHPRKHGGARQGETTGGTAGEAPPATGGQG